jgi:hypothetical protein
VLPQCIPTPPQPWPHSPNSLAHPPIVHLHRRELVSTALCSRVGRGLSSVQLVLQEPHLESQLPDGFGSLHSRR